MIGGFEDVLKERDLPYQRDLSAAGLSTFRIGGRVHFVIEPRCAGELINAVLICHHSEMPYAVIGKGSNILFGDDEISVVLIRTGALDAIRILENGRIFALCGASLATIAARAAWAGLGGFSFAAGIPGTLGGAVYMNAGAHGRAMGDVVESVEVLYPDCGQIRTVFNKELSYSYRNSIFQSEDSVIIGATLQLIPSCDLDMIKAEIRTLSQWRRVHQPLHLPSAGSVFQRPSPEISVAKIIDELGFKGTSVGGAQVSEKHAGFIVNKGGATARDVRALIRDIQNTVERERGFRPIPEIRFIPD
ncbi:MAG: UDP-N-acetylmuramate dehydrogenase [Clostridia bacterium]|nr:UDP-N-acetylmuramate dehydrogenase [Clostridia bacterium]